MPAAGHKIRPHGKHYTQTEYMNTKGRVSNEYCIKTSAKKDNGAAAGSCRDCGLCGARERRGYDRPAFGKIGL